MAKETKKVFSRKTVIERQEKAKEAMKKNRDEFRKALDRLAKTPDGEKLLRYLFVLSGGDKQSVRRNKEGAIDIEDTLLVLGAKSVYEDLRFNMTSSIIKKIERHLWEK